MTARERISFDVEFGRMMERVDDIDRKLDKVIKERDEEKKTSSRAGFEVRLGIVCAILGALPYSLFNIIQAVHRT